MIIEACITAALCVGARRIRLLSVMGLPVSLRPRLAEFRLPADHAGMARVSRGAPGARPCLRRKSISAVWRSRPQE
jgi:hypothetical protein